MFCPNCGTQNPDAADTCAKCNFHLKGAATPKFKGTMLLMNQPGGAGSSAVRGSSTPPPPGAAPGAVPNKLKGTMVGVAPMAGGPSPFGTGGAALGGSPPGAAGAPPPGGVQPATGPSAGPGGPNAGPAAHAPGAGVARFGQQTVAFGPPPGGMLPPTGHFAPPYGTGSGAGEPNAFSPPVPQPGVNPLGGTLAADPPAFPPGYAGPPGGSPAAGGPVRAALQATAMMPAGSTGASPYSPYRAGGDAPPPAAPPYDTAPNAPPYGARAPNPFEPPPGYRGAAASSYGADAGRMGHPGAEVTPYGQGASVPSSRVGPAPGSAPTRRHPLAVLLVPIAIMVFGAALSALLGLVIPALSSLGTLVVLAGAGLALWLTIHMANEVKAVTRNDAFAWWPVVVPIYGYYWMWVVVPGEVARAKQIRGVGEPVRATWLYVLLFPYALASDLNDLVR